MAENKVIELDSIYDGAYNEMFDKSINNYKEVAIFAMKNAHNQAVELCKKAISEDRLEDLKVWAMQVSNELPF